MKNKLFQFLPCALLCGLFFVGCDTQGIESTSEAPEGVAASPNNGRVQHTPVVAWMAAGELGGGVLEPGTVFPPNAAQNGTLNRGDESVRTVVSTSGLPPGAYTSWWVIFNNPAACTGVAPVSGVEGSRCGGSNDDYFNPDVMASVHWITGGVVKQNGIWGFTAATAVGDDLGEPGTQYIFGPGLVYPATAEVQVVIRYHGPASDDPAALYSQTHSIMGLCEAGANGVDVGFGPECFNPQVAIFAP
jgi:hypothetical protein